MTMQDVSACPTQATNVILHAFDWPYHRVAAHAEAIAAVGFKAVLVSPPMKSLRAEPATPWWQRYQPQDYRVIDNQLGNTEDFRRMTAKLQSLNLKIYADVVFNHMANESKVRSDLQYPSAVVLAAYQDQPAHSESLKLFGNLSEPLFTEQDFVSAFPIRDWTDPWQVQHGRISGGQEDPGLPTLRCNQHVVKAQQQYLRALKAIGVSGFRIDAAKHMTLEHLKQVWEPDIATGVHIFGEIITDGGASREEYELFLQPYLEQTQLGAYDFPLFHALFKVFEENNSMSELVNPYSVGQALAFDRAITFAVTHDIPNNDVFLDQVMSEQSERLAYCYLLGRDGGVPLIYADLDTSGICNQAGQPRWFDSWQDPMLQRMIRFHNRCHALPMQCLEYSDCHLVFSRGEAGVVAINNGQDELRINLPKGQYEDWLAMDGVTLTHGHQPQLRLPARTGAMLVRTQAPTA
ncbi:alpha-amylase family glycosyl hydrolase [Photobacterium sp. MCCC 1A19761]